VVAKNQRGAHVRAPPRPKPTETNKHTPASEAAWLSVPLEPVHDGVRDSAPNVGMDCGGLGWVKWLLAWLLGWAKGCGANEDGGGGPAAGAEYEP
jgi:hypothetical protein